jgi:membrane-bound lytic murein transglycosylase B
MRRWVGAPLGLAATLTVVLLAAATIMATNLVRVSSLTFDATASEPGIAESAAPSAPHTDDVAPAGSLALSQVDAKWVARTAAATGIPSRALVAYAAAGSAAHRQHPRCRLGWNTVAAIGLVESDHGSHAGAVLAADGRIRPAILGPVLDGSQSASIADSDAGALDGDAHWDRAVGPLQFLPSTWRRWGADGSGDGVADPNQIDDAALTAANYLCAAGGDLTSTAGWSKAIWSYNHSADYLARVREAANRYAREAR